MKLKTEVLNDLLEFDDLKIYQDTNTFNFSLDTVLLAKFVSIKKNAKTIMDIGTGNAPIPLILSRRTEAHIIGVEIQKELVELAKKSVEKNKLEKQIKIINADIVDEYKKMESDTISSITCNPPFFKVTENSRKNESNYKTIARHELFLDVEKVLLIAKKLLVNGGNIAIVHRPERLIEIITKMKENNLEPKKMRLIYPFKGENAHILLIEGYKNGKPGLKILDPLYVHNKDGSYTEEVKEYFR